MTFVHLRASSDYSFLASAARIKDLVAAATLWQMPALALTDTNLHGALDFQRTCAKAEVKPIFGLDVPYGDTRLLLHAATNTGLRSLFALASLPHLAAGVTDDDLDRHRAGLLAVAEPSMYWAAEEVLGQDATFSNGPMRNRGLLSRQLATQDIRYVRNRDRETLAALRALAAGGRLVEHLEGVGEQLMMRSPQDMAHAWRDHPHLLEVAGEYASRCEASLESRVKMPVFPVPDGHTPQSWLRVETERGLTRLYGATPSAEIRQRAEYELSVIDSTGFPSYFLVVADYVRWARGRGIQVSCRGSGAGSLVGYSLGITSVDPVKYGLFFERFLNPERVSLPDYDLDFDDKRRPEIFDYLVRTYGREYAAQIATIGDMRGKASIKDANRVLGFGYGLGERMSNAMGGAVAGRPMDLSAVTDSEHPRYGDGQPMRDLLELDTNAQMVFQLAGQMEGLHRQTGVHAAGIIVSSEPLVEHTALAHRDNDLVLTQFDWVDADALGLVKFDILGLATLTVIGDTIKAIRRAGLTPPDLDALVLDPTDPDTFDMLAAGETVGVFQLDSRPMQNLMRLMRCSSFNDIRATIALYRPGPMAVGSHTAYANRKTGRELNTPMHPEVGEALADILGETYNVLVYQEHILAIARKLAGYTLGGADLLRKAVGKKSVEAMAAEKDKLIAGMLANGYSQDCADTVWHVFEGNADYLFNKSHATAYAAVVWQTAYLKRHFPAQYMAALLTSVSNDKVSTASYLTECRRLGIQVLPPDARRSEAGYSVHDGKILFGLGAVAGLGESTVAALADARPATEPTSALEWVACAPAGARNKKALDALVKAGAFSWTGHPRRALLGAVADVLTAGKAAAVAAGHGLRLFPPGAATPIPDLPEYSREELLALERATLGLYVSDHPLAVLAQDVAQLATHSIGQLEQAEDKDRVRLAGIVALLQHKTTKAGGRPWAIATLEDLDGTVEVLLFPNSWAPIRHLIQEGAILQIDGRVSRRDGGLSVMPDSVSVLDPHDSATPVVIRLAARLATPELIGDLLDYARAYPGQAPLELALHEGRQWRHLMLAHVAPHPELILDIKAMLGPKAVRLG